MEILHSDEFAVSLKDGWSKRWLVLTTGGDLKCYLAKDGCSPELVINIFAECISVLPWTKAKDLADWPVDTFDETGLILARQYKDNFAMLAEDAATTKIWFSALTYMIKHNDIPPDDFHMPARLLNLESNEIFARPKSTASEEIVSASKKIDASNIVPSIISTAESSDVDSLIQALKAATIGLQEAHGPRAWPYLTRVKEILENGNDARRTTGAFAMLGGGGDVILLGITEEMEASAQFLVLKTLLMKAINAYNLARDGNKASTYQSNMSLLGNVFTTAADLAAMGVNNCYIRLLGFLFRFDDLINLLNDSRPLTTAKQYTRYMWVPHNPGVLKARPQVLQQEISRHGGVRAAPDLLELQKCLRLLDQVSSINPYGRFSDDDIFIYTQSEATFTVIKQIAVAKFSRCESKIHFLRQEDFNPANHEIMFQSQYPFRCLIIQARPAGAIPEDDLSNWMGAASLTFFHDKESHLQVTTQGTVTGRSIVQRGSTAAVMGNLSSADFAKSLRPNQSVPLRHSYEWLHRIAVGLIGAGLGDRYTNLICGTNFANSQMMLSERYAEGISSLDGTVATNINTDAVTPNIPENSKLISLFAPRVLQYEVTIDGKTYMIMQHNVRLNFQPSQWANAIVDILVDEIETRSNNAPKIPSFLFRAPLSLGHSALAAAAAAAPTATPFTLDAAVLKQYTGLDVVGLRDMTQESQQKFFEQAVKLDPDSCTVFFPNPPLPTDQIKVGNTSIFGVGCGVRAYYNSTKRFFIAELLPADTASGSSGSSGGGSESESGSGSGSGSNSNTAAPFLKALFPEDLRANIKERLVLLVHIDDPSKSQVRAALSIKVAALFKFIPGIEESLGKDFELDFFGDFGISTPSFDKISFGDTVCLTARTGPNTNIAITDGFALTEIGLAVTVVTCMKPVGDKLKSNINISLAVTASAEWDTGFGSKPAATAAAAAAATTTPTTTTAAAAAAAAASGSGSGSGSSSGTSGPGSGSVANTESSGKVTMGFLAGLRNVTDINTAYFTGHLANWALPFGGILVEDVQLQIKSFKNLDIDLAVCLSLDQYDLYLTGSWSKAQGLDVSLEIDGKQDFGFLRQLHQGATRASSPLPPPQDPSLQSTALEQVLVKYSSQDSTVDSITIPAGLFVQAVMNLEDKQVKVAISVSQAKGITVEGMVKNVNIANVLVLDEVDLMVHVSPQTDQNSSGSYLQGFAQFSIPLPFGGKTLGPVNLLARFGAQKCFAAGIPSKFSFGLGSINPALSFLDMGFSSLYFTYSSIAQQISIPLDPSSNGSAITLNLVQGKVFMGNAEFGLLKQLLGTDIPLGFVYTFEDQQNNQPASFKITPGPGHATIDPSSSQLPSKRLSGASGINFAIELAPIASLQVGFQTGFTLFGQAGVVKAGFSLQDANSMLSVSLFGEVSAVGGGDGFPLSIASSKGKGIRLLDVNISAEILPVFGTLAVGGTVRFGHNDEATAIVKIQMNEEDPAKDAFFIQLDHATLSDILTLSLQLIGIDVQIPLLDQIKIEHLMLYWAPQGMTIKNTAITGFGFDADLVLFGASLHAAIIVDESKGTFMLDAQCDPMSILGGVIALTGWDGRGGPHVHLLASANITESEFLLDCACKFIFVTSKAKVHIKVPSLLDLQIQYSILGLDTTITAKGSTESKTLQVAFELSAGHRAQFQEGVVRQIKAAARQMQKDAEVAEAEGNQAIEAYNKGLAQLEKELQDAQAAFDAYEASLQVTVNQETTSLSNLETDTKKGYDNIVASLQDSADNFKKILQDTKAKLSSDLDTAMAAINKFSAQTKTLNDEVNQEIQAATNTFNSQLADANKHIKNAAGAVQEAQANLDIIKSHKPPSGRGCSSSDMDNWNNQVHNAQQAVTRANQEHQEALNFLNSIKVANSENMSSLQQKLSNGLQAIQQDTTKAQQNAETIKKDIALLSQNLDLTRLKQLQEAKHQTEVKLSAVERAKRLEQAALSDKQMTKSYAELNLQQSTDLVQKLKAIVDANIAKLDLGRNFAVAENGLQAQINAQLGNMQALVQMLEPGKALDSVNTLLSKTMGFSNLTKNILKSQDARFLQAISPALYKAVSNLEAELAGELRYVQDSLKSIHNTLTYAHTMLTTPKGWTELMALTSSALDTWKNYETALLTLHRLESIAGGATSRALNVLTSALNRKMDQLVTNVPSRLLAAKPSVQVIASGIKSIFAESAKAVEALESSWAKNSLEPNIQKFMDASNTISTTIAKFMSNRLSDMNQELVSEEQLKQAIADNEVQNAKAAKAAHDYADTAEASQAKIAELGKQTAALEAQQKVDEQNIQDEYSRLMGGSNLLKILLDIAKAEHVMDLTIASQKAHLEELKTQVDQGFQTAGNLRHQDIPSVAKDRVASAKSHIETYKSSDFAHLVTAASNDIKVAAQAAAKAAAIYEEMCKKESTAFFSISAEADWDGNSGDFLLKFGIRFGFKLYIDLGFWKINLDFSFSLSISINLKEIMEIVSNVFSYIWKKIWGG